jgi:hypothetical protein
MTKVEIDPITGKPMKGPDGKRRGGFSSLFHSAPKDPSHALSGKRQSDTKKKPSAPSDATPGQPQYRPAASSRYAAVSTNPANPLLF